MLNTFISDLKSECEEFFSTTSRETVTSDVHESGDGASSFSTKCGEDQAGLPTRTITDYGVGATDLSEYLIEKAAAVVGIIFAKKVVHWLEYEFFILHQSLSHGTSTRHTASAPDSAEKSPEQQLVDQFTELFQTSMMKGEGAITEAGVKSGFLRRRETVLGRGPDRRPNIKRKYFALPPTLKGKTLEKYWGIWKRKIGLLSDENTIDYTPNIIKRRYFSHESRFVFPLAVVSAYMELIDYILLDGMCEVVGTSNLMSLGKAVLSANAMPSALEEFCAEKAPLISSLLQQRLASVMITRVGGFVGVQYDGKLREPSPKHFFHGKVLGADRLPIGKKSACFEKIAGNAFDRLQKNNGKKKFGLPAVLKMIEKVIRQLFPDAEWPDGDETQYLAAVPTEETAGGSEEGGSAAEGIPDGESDGGGASASPPLPPPSLISKKFPHHFKRGDLIPVGWLGANHWHDKLLPRISGETGRIFRINKDHSFIIEFPERLEQTGGAEGGTISDDEENRNQIFGPKIMKRVKLTGKWPARRARDDATTGTTIVHSPGTFCDEDKCDDAPPTSRKPISTDSGEGVEVLDVFEPVIFTDWDKMEDFERTREQCCADVFMVRGGLEDLMKVRDEEKHKAEDCGLIFSRVRQFL